MDIDWQGLFIKIPVTDELSQQAAAHAIQHPIKGADAVHLSTALVGSFDLFVASDDTLLKAAKKVGMSIYNPAMGVFNRTK